MNKYDITFVWFSKTYWMVGIEYERDFLVIGFGLFLIEINLD